jgi:hypothetical protein
METGNYVLEQSKEPTYFHIPYMQDAPSTTSIKPTDYVTKIIQALISTPLFS